MAEYATRLANGQDTAARMRRSDALALTPAGNGLARTGLRPDGGGQVSINTGTMGVTVQPFTAWVSAASAAQGGYPVALDAAKVLAISPGHATLLRTDTVVAQVRDTSHDGSGFTDARVYVLEGTPGAGQAALPATSIPLFDVLVLPGTSSGTGGLTGGALGPDRRVYTTASGGVLPTTTNPPSPYRGQTIYRTDLDAHLTYDGTKWSRVIGSETSAAGPGGTLTTTAQVYRTVTLPPGKWTLIGKGNFAWSIGSPGEELTAELRQGTTQVDQAKLQLAYNNGTSPWSVLAQVTLTAASTVVQIRAWTSGADGTQLVNNVQLAAIPG